MRWNAIAAVVVLAYPALAGDVIRSEAVGLRFTVPRPWDRVPATADIRAAQWKLRRAPGDLKDGELVLFFFGTGQDVSAWENLDRWYGQFARPDGRSSDTAAVVTTQAINSLKVTTVDLAGTYKAGPTSDGPLAPPERGFRLLAAAVEGEDGPWLFRAIGPERTIAAARPGFDAMLASLAPHR